MQSCDLSLLLMAKSTETSLPVLITRCFGTLFIIFTLAMVLQYVAQAGLNAVMTLTLGPSTSTIKGMHHDSWLRLYYLSNFLIFTRTAERGTFIFL